MNKGYLLSLMGLALFSISHASDMDGKKLFVSKCAMCHGANAKGKPAMAKAKNMDLTALDLTRPLVGTKSLVELQKIVVDGQGKMVGFKGKLTALETESVAQYVKSLQPAPGAKKEVTPAPTYKPARPVKLKKP